MKLNTAANILTKIGNPTRLKIVRLLVRAGDDGLAVGDIKKKLKVPGSTLTHHISHLESAGVIAKHRHQTMLICKVEFYVIQDLVDYLIDECCLDMADREFDA